MTSDLYNQTFLDLKKISSSILSSSQCFPMVIVLILWMY